MTNELGNGRTPAQHHLSAVGLTPKETLWTRGTTDLLDNKTTLLLIEPDRTGATTCQPLRGMTETMLHPDLEPLTTLSVTVE